jgi:hypothetical protein
MGDAFGLAVDHADDLADFADRVADLAEALLRGAAALDAGLDLGRDGARLAGQLADGEAIWLVAARVSWASFFTSAATTAKLRPASPARAASMVALSASMLVLRAIASMVEETLCTWFIAEREAGHAVAQLDDQFGQALEAGDVSSIAARPGLELGLGLLGQQPRFVGRIGHRAWSASSRVVTSSSVSSVLRLDEMRSETPAT